MDAQSSSSFRDRWIGDSENLAFSAPESHRSYLKKDLPFAFSSFGRIFSSGSEASQGFSGIFRPVRKLPVTTAFMPFSHVFFLIDPFKIVCSVIRLITIFVMDKMSMIGMFKPTNGNHSVVECASASEVSLFARFRNIGLQFSKNFPATRNSIKVAKESVFDSIYRSAYHVALLGGYNIGKVS